MHPALRVYFQGALKQPPLRPDDMFYQKRNFAGLGNKYFTFMTHVLFYTFS